MNIKKMSKSELESLKQELEVQYNAICQKGLKLDMSRGKPGPSQLSLTNSMLSILSGAVYRNGVLSHDFMSQDGIDCRNYGVLDGIAEAKRLFMPILDAAETELFIGGNSSLNLMYDVLLKALAIGVYNGRSSWQKQAFIASYNEKAAVKFLCPVPGYDRHFAICQSLGIEMINIKIDENGQPDIDKIEELVAADPLIKGIWCVPMYSNPTGATYSDDTVRRLASLKTAADDFRIFWDNAYIVHHLTDTPDTLLNIRTEAKKAGNPDIVYEFTSTSKISFPGGGLAILASSENNIKFLKNQFGFQTIGFDKLNQLRHAKFFKDHLGLKAHMERHRAIVQPKFDCVLSLLEKNLEGTEIGKWIKPRGGYFVCFEGLPGTAKRTVHLCKKAGVVLTDAGAPFPYGIDPNDNIIRIAPTYPELCELTEAMNVFCIAEKIAAIEVLE